MTCETKLTTFEVKFAADGAAGTFEGYAAVFGNLDSYGDVIQKGAFKETLRDWKRSKRLPPMLHQHAGGFFGGADDLLPIGKWTSMVEDDTGLLAEGKLINLDTERGKGIYGAMKEGVLDGISIGYVAKEWALGTKPEEPRRTLKKIQLVEASIVTLPANDKARVSAVKSAADIRTIRDFESFLRDVGKFSHAAAKDIALHGFKASEPRDEDEADLLALVRRNIATLT